jgi:hypothetical protein
MGNPQLMCLAFFRYSRRLVLDLSSSAWRACLPDSTAAHLSSVAIFAFFVALRLACKRELLEEVAEYRDSMDIKAALVSNNSRALALSSADNSLATSRLSSTSATALSNSANLRSRLASNFLSLSTSDSRDCLQPSSISNSDTWRLSSATVVSFSQQKSLC